MPANRPASSNARPQTSEQFEEMVYQLIKGTGQQQYYHPTTPYEFRELLRAIKENSEFTFGQLAQATPWSRSALHKATMPASVLPSLPLVKDLLRACKMPRPVIDAVLSSWHRLDRSRTVPSSGVLNSTVPSTVPTHQTRFWGQTAGSVRSPAPILIESKSGPQSHSAVSDVTEDLVRASETITEHLNAVADLVHATERVITQQTPASDQSNGRIPSLIDMLFASWSRTLRVVLLVLLLGLLTAAGTWGVMIMGTIVDPVFALLSPLVVVITILALGFGSILFSRAFRNPPHPRTTTDPATDTRSTS